MSLFAWFLAELPRENESVTPEFLPEFLCLVRRGDTVLEVVL